MESELAVLAISIVNYFSSSDLRACLDSLASTHNSDSALLALVDNSEDDEEWKRVTRLAHEYSHRFVEIKATKASRNLGFGAGHNLAIGSLTSQDYDHILILNPDVTIIHGRISPASGTTGYLAGMEVMQRGRVTAGLSRMNVLTGATKRVLQPTQHRYEYPDGHCLLIDRRLWEDLQGFDEDYFLYCEELDFVLRCYRRHGIRPRVLHGVRVEHIGGTSTESMFAKSTLTSFHANRSRVLLYRKHRLPRLALAMMISLRVGLATLHFVTGKRAHASSVIRGIWEGITMREICS